MHLYQIKQEYEDLMTLAHNLAEANEGVIPDELDERIEEIEGDLTEKVTNCALAYKNFSAEAAAIKEEEKALAKRRKSLETRADWLRLYIDRNFPDKGEIKTPQVVVSRRRSEIVAVYDPNKLPDAYCRIEIVSLPDKIGIKNAIKAGKEVEGARLVESWNLYIR